jgi:hypothetical protein
MNHTGTLWAKKCPSADELIQKFDLFIWDQVHTKARRLDGTPQQITADEKKDMHNDVVVELLKTRKQFWLNYSYMMEVIKHAAQAAVDNLRGAVMLNGKRKSEYFEFIEEHNPDSINADGFTDRIKTEIAEKSSTRSNVEETLTVERVRARLSGRALKVFDWVLNDREKHNTTGLSEYCSCKWQMSEKSVNKLREQIADAMHAEGMALNYPSPIVNRRDMTSLQRKQWLDAIRKQKHDSLASAARANDVLPFNLNYHTQRLYGMTFLEWSKKAP